MRNKAGNSCYSPGLPPNPQNFPQNLPTTIEFDDEGCRKLGVRSQNADLGTEAEGKTFNRLKGPLIEGEAVLKPTK
ncbi:hypothetical protein V6N13_137596 [Hibiscus sabdariffa]|uniref:Uncharacterized protein n=1 Tax=Hibiscus sabdariffa TaxID=183260 RepID=A0ABR2DK58_9ROSI